MNNHNNRPITLQAIKGHINYRKPLPKRMPTDMNDMAEILKISYDLGYADGQAHEKRTGMASRWTITTSGGNITYSLREAAAIIQGLPTAAICGVLGIAADGKHSRGAKQVREGLRMLGYKQRSARYKGEVVAGWFSQPVIHDTDLPI